MKIQLIKSVEIDDKGNEKITDSTTYFSKKRLRGSELQRNLSIGNAVDKIVKENGLNEEAIDLMCDYICEYFGNQFTKEEFLDGTYLENILPTYQKISEEIANRYLMKVQETIKN